MFFKEELMTDETPKPGSDAAVKLGCLCPVMDNHHGNGFPALDQDGGRRTAYWINGNCPIHGIRHSPEVVDEQQGN